MAGGVAPERQRRVAAAGGEALDQLRDDERFEDGAAERMALQRAGVRDAEQVADQAGVEEVEAQPRRAVGQRLRRRLDEQQVLRAGQSYRAESVTASRF